MNLDMTSTIRYSGPPIAGTITCPICNKEMITSYLNRTTEAGVAFQCPNCYEWLRIKELPDSRPPNLTNEEAKRWHPVEIVRLGKAEINKMLQKNTNTETEIFEWEAS
jgi:uncharacterized protein YbaR (Trm112 family)